MDDSNNEIRIRGLIFINMENILTDEEKKYLRMVCKYLRSYGLDHGLVYVDLEERGLNLDDADFNDVSYFDNKYGLDLPEKLPSILNKILEYIVSNVEYEQADVDYLNYERLEVEIDAINREIRFVYSFGYTDEGDGNSLSWDEEDDPEEIKRLFEELVESGVDTSSRYIELRYEGSGDSGYINSEFSDGTSVPAVIEDWCYDKLESDFGGWEINEGAQGVFIFDFKDKRIILEHIWNENIDRSDDIISFKF